jgi:hypothetical protein
VLAGGEKSMKSDRGTLASQGLTQAGTDKVVGIQRDKNTDLVVPRSNWTPCIAVTCACNCQHIGLTITVFAVTLTLIYFCGCHGLLLRRCHYTGRLASNVVFDSSYERGRPLTFKVVSSSSSSLQCDSTRMQLGSALLTCKPIWAPAGAARCCLCCGI